MIVVNFFAPEYRERLGPNVVAPVILPSDAGETEPISPLRAAPYRVIAAVVQGSNNNVIVTPGPIGNRPPKARSSSRL